MYEFVDWPHDLDIDDTLRSETVGIYAYEDMGITLCIGCRYIAWICREQ